MIKLDKIEDIYSYVRHIYTCQRCGQLFPIWWVSKAEWKAGGFKRKAVCKRCFEKVVPSPHYLGIDEYMEERIPAADGGDNQVETRKILSQIWAMGDELSTLDEESREWVLGRGAMPTGILDLPVSVAAKIVEAKDRP
jgi:hypothetical protein